MLLTLYDLSGNVKATLSPNDTSTQEKEIQSDNVLSLSFKLYEYVEIDVNDYVDFEGERYWAMEKYLPQEKSSVEWEYDVKLYGVESLIKRFLVLNDTDGSDEAVFTLTAPPIEHMRLIVRCINAGMQGLRQWMVGTVEGTENVVIDYNGKYCDVALKELAQIVGTEWWTDGVTMNLCRCERGSSLQMAYGEGLTGLERDVADNVKFYTRLFPIGSSRNIDASTYGSTRLQLPGGAKYVDVSNLVEKYGIIHHYEENAFADIYPRRIGTISYVRQETARDDDGNNYTIYYFKDNDLSFDPNDYMLPGERLRVSFQEGSELAGLGTGDEHYFEVDYNSENGEFEITTIWPYNDDTQIPGGQLVPQIGDKYILWNLRMPQEYVTAAENEFLIAVESYNAIHGVDVSRYKGQTDHVWVEDTSAELYVGRRVKLLSEEYFPITGYRESRITKLTRCVNLPSQVDLEISDALSTDTLTSINNSVDSALKYFRTVLGGLSLPDIIRRGDNNRWTDDNLLSALRSKEEFLSRLHDDIAHGRITFAEGLVSLGTAVFGSYERGDVNSGAAIFTNGLGDFLNLRVIGKVLGDLSVEGCAKVADLVFSSILKSQGGSPDSDGTGIYMDALKGTIFTDGLDVRGWMRIAKFVYNMIQVMEQDYMFGGGGDIEESIDNGDGTYTLKIHKEKEGRHTSFSEYDILMGKADEGLTQGGSYFYYTSWSHVCQNGVTLNDGMTPDTVRVELWADNMVPGGRNFAPKKMMTLARRGNTQDPERQAFWELSTTDKRLTHYWNVDQPILRADNYALCLGIMPTILDTAGVLPDTRDPRMPSLYVNTIFYENAHHIYYPSRIVKEERGEWTLTPTSTYTGVGGTYTHDGTLSDENLAAEVIAGRMSAADEARLKVIRTWTGTYVQGQTISEPYHFESFNRNMWLTHRLSPAHQSLSDLRVWQKMTKEWHVDKETSRAWRYGALWECLVEGTMQAPEVGCTDWTLIQQPAIVLQITATKRLLRKRDFEPVGTVGTTLGFVLQFGGYDMTADIQRSEAVWTRQSVGADDDELASDKARALAAADAAWNQQHRYGDLTLGITKNDLPSNWTTAKEVQFTLTVTKNGTPLRHKSITLH